ncbi:MAG: response regulator [Geobacter sp.]|nr:response regulator [Geobacter sp.]
MVTEIKKILLVEDNPNDAEMTMDALAETNLGNEVVWLKDGQQALDYLHCTGEHAGRNPVNPGLILLDLKMPKVDGLQVLKVLKATPALQPIPVVILTSSREEIDLLESYKNGVNGYVVKPVEFGAFMEAIKALGIYWAIINLPPKVTI